MNSFIFDVAKMQEMQGLAKRGVCKIVCREDALANANVLGGLFVLAIKDIRTGNEV